MFDVNILGITTVSLSSLIGFYKLMNAYIDNKLNENNKILKDEIIGIYEKLETIKKDISNSIIEYNKKFDISHEEVKREFKSSINEFKNIIKTLEDFKTNNQSEKYQYLTKMDTFFNELKIIENTFDNVDRNTEKIYELIEKMKEFISEVNNNLKMQYLINSKKD